MPTSTPKYDRVATSEKGAPPDGAVPEEEERPLTEGEKLQMAIDKATFESLDATRRMLAYCEEAKESGLQTLVMLDDQGEQLERIDEGMDQINQDMRDAEKNLDDLNKCCGLCVLPWNKVKNFERSADYDKTWKANEDGTVNADGPRIIVDQNGAAAGGFITRITNDAKEDEMDQNMSDISGMVGNLRNMAVDMGNEIGSQNRLLERIVSKAESNEERVRKANVQANKLLVK